MKLFRGFRHPDGLADVLVCSSDGEKWLRGHSPASSKGKLQYSWGDDGPGTRMLALHLLENMLPDPEYAPDLAEALAADWLAQMNIDRWAIPDYELTDWIMEELVRRVEALRVQTNGGLPPCPSEN